MNYKNFELNVGTDWELKEKSVSKDLRFSKTERMNSSRTGTFTF